MGWFLKNPSVRGCPEAKAKTLRRRSAKQGSPQKSVLKLEAFEERCLLSGGTLESSVPTTASRPTGITSGPDGALWFTEYFGNKIGRITTDGVITNEFPIPTGGTPHGIATLCGDLWFADAMAPKIGRVTTAGSFTEYPINSWSPYVTVGPDGNIWFTESEENKIGRLSCSGALSEWTIPDADTWPSGIAAGPDGNLWFTENVGNRVRRIMTDGTFLPPTEIPTANAQPANITAGADGNMWFTEQSHWGNAIGLLNLDHNYNPVSITECEVPTPDSAPTGITLAPDGNVWFTEQAVNKIGRITPSCEITEFSAPTQSPATLGALITVGPDKNIWFTEELANKIVKFYLLSATGLSLTGTAGQPLRGVIATFHDNEPGMVPANYSVQIAWGDGKTSAGRVRGGAQGNWFVTGGHVYSAPGQYEVTVTITDTHPGGMTSTATSTANIAGGTAPGSGGNNPSAAAAFLDGSVEPMVDMRSQQPLGANRTDGRTSGSISNLAIPIAVAEPCCETPTLSRLTPAAHDEQAQDWLTASGFELALQDLLA